MTPEARATKVGEIMWGQDVGSRNAGIELIEVMPGSAVCTLRVTENHSNGVGICHGGYIFALADTAFAFACNSYNVVAVAQNNTISYLKPGAVGDVLTATATEIHRAARSGIYDVAVQNQHSETIALFRGNCRTVKGQHFDENV